MRTTLGINSPQAVKRWANELARDTTKQMYFTKFIGTGENNIIERKVDLEQSAGDEIIFDLSLKLRGDMTEGDDVVEGREENLTFLQDRVRIDQARKGADAGGRMTRKRTLHNLRQIAKDRVAEYTAEWTDELMIVYLSGTAPGTYINEDSLVKRPFATNPIEAPDNKHLAFGGSATSKATLEATHKMNRDLIERVAVMPRTMASTDATGTTVKMVPVTVEGGKHFVMLMNPYQMFDLRNEKTELSWADVQKAAAAAQGKNNPLFNGSAGMIANMVLHEHENVRRFSDYGAGANVEAARALVLGRQAGVLAYGNGGNGTRFQWVEESKDAGNRVAIYAGAILGFKKSRYGSRDFGVIAVDTAAKSPNPVIAG
ncbi:N4-gp56 family major capsid protein [Paracoccus sp. SY]|uniref:N4-gp56 family major capsid protein n=1 Tax=Paracoccus sp. SY TaxID=1330255 RepID=UPI000CD0163C|nr:N4-gp56 family major capsid protein [Paracoccus sp. SY]